MPLNRSVQPITMPYQFQQQTVRADWSNNVRKEILKWDVACKWSRGTFNAL